jgi:hypothetical protein
MPSSRPSRRPAAEPTGDAEEEAVPPATRVRQLVLELAAASSAAERADCLGELNARLENVAGEQLLELLGRMSRAGINLLVPSADDSGQAKQLQLAALKAGAAPLLVALLEAPEEEVACAAASALPYLAPQGGAKILADARTVPSLLRMAMDDSKIQSQYAALMAVRALAGAGHGAALGPLVQPLLGLLDDDGAQPQLHRNTAAAMALLEMHGCIAGGERRRREVVEAAARHLLALCARRCRACAPPAEVGDGPSRPSHRSEEQLAPALDFAVRTTLMRTCHSAEVARVLAQPPCFADLLATLEPGYAAASRDSMFLASATGYVLQVMIDGLLMLLATGGRLARRRRCWRGADE